MKNTKKIISSIIIGVFAISLTGCKMIEKTPKAIAKSTVAKVGGKKITRGEIDEQLVYLKDQLKEKYGANYENNGEAKEELKKNRQQVLEAMISNIVIENKAKDLKIKVDEKELDQVVEKSIKGIKDKFKTKEEYEKALKKEKLTEDVLKKRIRDNEGKKLLGSKVYDAVVKDVKVDEKEIKDYYTMHMNELTEKPNGIEAADILVDTQEEAKKIKKDLDGGADFAKLAKEKSKDEKTKANGGGLGFLTYNELFQKQYLASAMTLKAGQITNPVKSEDGWHVIKVIRKEENPPKKFDDAKEQIKDTLLNDKKTKKWTAENEKWTKDAKIKKYEKNLE